MKNPNERFVDVAKINAVLAKGNTGNAKEFAAKVAASERKLFYYLKFMREILEPHGIQILNDRVENTYYYSKPGNLKLDWVWEPKKG